MTDDSIFQHGAYWTPTKQLRFVAREGGRILQQLWLNITEGQQEWRDVPLEAEEATPEDQPHE